MSTPRYAAPALVGLNEKEFGAEGRFTGVPALKTEGLPLRVTGMTRVVQAWVVLPHAVVVTYVARGLLVAPVT